MKMMSKMPGLAIGLAFLLLFPSMLMADVIINVMAVNGAPEAKKTTVKFNLPSDLGAGDIVDTDGLELLYNVPEANFYVQGDVVLESQQSKVFKIRVRDIWRLTPDQVDKLRNDVQEGYDQLGSLQNVQNAQLLRDKLLERIDVIAKAQASKAESIEQRIDSYRAYQKEIKRIATSALMAEYWRSDPSIVDQKKLIRLNIEVTNPHQDKSRPVKHKYYLPQEVKPEHVVEAQGFDVRYDQQKQQNFLFKEEELGPAEKKLYNIGIENVWFILQTDIDYYRYRANYAKDFLKNSKFSQTANSLYDSIDGYLKSIEDSQQVTRPIEGHISAYRDNKETLNQALNDLDVLEKLLALYREDLEKTKVGNVLKRIKTLNNLENISKALFGKKLTVDRTFKLISYIALFVGVITLIGYLVWLMRSKEKRIIREELSEKMTEPIKKES